MSDAPATFQTRLKNIMNGTYNPSMRRSVQTIVLYEADRCLKSVYKQLRPFQRKIALYDCAADLVNTLDWIPAGHAMEVMYRTASGKTPLSPDLAWRRMKIIDREIAKTIIPGVKPFICPELTHQQACDAYIESQYQSIAQPKDEAVRPVPELWEYSHISIFLAYRMYYDGEAIATDLPPPIDPNPKRKVPKEKPEAYPLPPLVPGVFPPLPAGDGYVSDELVSGSPDDDTRRAMLKEVKDHMDVIKQLEGIMPPAEAQQRKRALYAAMPPPPGPYKKARRNNSTVPVPLAAASDGEDSEEAMHI